MWETQETERLKWHRLLWPGQRERKVRGALLLALRCLGFSSRCAMCYCCCLEANLSLIWGPPADNMVPKAKFQIPLPTGTALPHTRGLPGAPATQELALHGFPQARSFPQTSQGAFPRAPAVARLQAGALALSAGLAESGADGSAWRQRLCRWFCDVVDGRPGLTLGCRASPLLALELGKNLNQSGTA
uniref:Uncharacterized protein n=1 Tax=Mus musculus TaxID=10090 RepID=Q8C4V0_MOUSE|nr:unnamed protein product [Mus musculus]